MTVSGKKYGPVGVVLPGYGHPQFLAEAVLSACEQDIDAEVKVVVVDDGCRFPETAQITQNLMRRFPGKLFYLRQKNTRLPGARNAGIRFLLNLEPELDTVYFLDADNRISPHSLRVFREALGDTPSVGWAYPDIGFFGLTWSEIGVAVRETAPEYSRLKHLAGNISEAGSMVRADMFRKGVFFDETMRSGFEDWDFWLSALDAGFTGIRAENSGFMYRRRPESMLAESMRIGEELVARLRRQHENLYKPRNLMQLEQNEAPYFAIFILDEDEVVLTSDPHLVRETLTKDEFARRLREWNDCRREFFFPPQILCLTRGCWKGLKQSPHWLRWLFWTIKETKGDSHLFCLENSEHPNLKFSPASGGLPSILMLTAEAWWDFSKKAEPDMVATMVTSGACNVGLPGIAPIPVEAPSIEDFCQYIYKFFAEFSSERKKMANIDYRYSGPNTTTIREELIDELCAEEDHKSFPCASAAQRILVAVDYQALSNSVGLERFIAILQRLFDDGVEVLLVMECDSGLNLDTLQPERWVPFVEDIVPMPHDVESVGYRMYLGRRIKALAHDTSKLLASVASRSVDSILTIGAPSFLKVLGHARLYGAKGYLLLEKSFIQDEDICSSSLISTVLAFEHVEECLVIDDHDLKVALSAEGIPAGKFMNTKDFFSNPPWEKDKGLVKKLDSDVGANLE